MKTGAEMIAEERPEGEWIDAQRARNGVAPTPAADAGKAEDDHA